MFLLLPSLAFALPAPCHSMSLEPWNSPLKPLPYPSHKAPTKEVRTVIDLPNRALSDNFVLHWGDETSLSVQKQEEILDYLEWSWTHEIEVMQYPAPYGTDQYLFNVYMGSSGSGAPSDAGVAGYYTTDEDGWPMVVLGQYVAENDDQYSVIPHEFFHAVQHSTERYPYSGPSAWYWEATATWMENQVLPDDPNYAVFLFGYAFLPHQSLLFFDYFDTGTIEEYHQYGAFIFPQFLSEYYSGSDWIRDSWVMDLGHEDPFSALLDGFEAEGLDPNAVFAEFAASNAYWDYTHQDWYTYYLDYYATYFSGFDQRVVEQLHPNGTGGWVESSDVSPLEYASYHHIRLENSTYDTLYLSFEGNETGTDGSEAMWSLTIVRKLGDAVTYDWLGTTSRLNSVPIAALGVADELTISISLLAGQYIEGEHFDYRYRLVPNPEMGGSEEPTTKQCGCHATPNKPWEMLSGLLLVAGFTRVRRQSHRHPRQSAVHQ